MHDTATLRQLRQRLERERRAGQADHRCRGLATPPEAKRAEMLARLLLVDQMRDEISRLRTTPPGTA